MRKHSLRFHMVSVRLSVCQVRVLYCIQTAEDNVKLLSGPRTPVIPVFLTASAGPQFPQETPSAWVQNTCGVRKFAISNEIADHFGNGTRRVYGCYESLIRSRRRCIDPCRFRWLSVTWKSRTTGSKFLAGSPDDNTVWRRLTKFTR